MILDDGTTQIVFTDHLVWLDEFAWNPIAQSKDITIGGTLVIQEAKQLKGRPITLVGGNEVWETRATVKALHDASLLLDQVFTLTLFGGATKIVMFDKSQQPVDTEALFKGQDGNDTDQFIIKALRFIEVG